MAINMANIPVVMDMNHTSTIDNFQRLDVFSMRLMSEGGQASVFAGWIKKGRGWRRVAVKIYRSHPSFLPAFLREICVLHHCKHPNIVKLLGRYLDHTTQGLILEYLTGINLRQLFFWLYTSRAAISTATARYIVWQILDALNHLHEVVSEQMVSHQLVHGDITPENIFLTTDGRVYLIDFGNVWTSANEPAGLVFGKSKYFSPEQRIGDDLGPWSDIYGLALTAFELIFGRPYREELLINEFNLLERHLKVLDLNLYHWFRACLAPSPWLRPQSAIAASGILSHDHGQCTGRDELAQMVKEASSQAAN